MRKKHEPHRSSYTRLYRIWEGIRIRCSASATGDERRDYFLAGIRVCLEWRVCFQTFKEWSLENGYQNHLSLDRKDPNGNYESDNCRWATASQQMTNKRKHPNCKSKYKGVCWNRQRNKWMAYINANGRRKYLGLFKNEVEAAETYDTTARKAYKEFARTNFS